MLSMAWCDHSSIMFPTDDGRVFLLPCTFHYVQLFILRVINIKVLTTSFGKSARSTVVVLTWKQKIKVQCCARTPKWLVGLLSDSTRLDSPVRNSDKQVSCLGEGISDFLRRLQKHHFCVRTRTSWFGTAPFLVRI